MHEPQRRSARRLSVGEYQSDLSTHLSAYRAQLTHNSDLGSLGGRSARKYGGCQMVGRASCKAPLGDPQGFLNSGDNKRTMSSVYRPGQLCSIMLHGHCVEYRSGLCSLASLKFRDVSQPIDVACVHFFLLCVYSCDVRRRNIRARKHTYTSPISAEVGAKIASHQL